MVILGCLWVGLFVVHRVLDRSSRAASSPGRIADRFQSARRVQAVLVAAVGVGRNRRTTGSSDRFEVRVGDRVVG